MRALVPVLLACLLLAGCGFRGAHSLPLPGAIDGPDTYRVTVVLADATKLVPKETCRSNDVVVGSIESITLDERLRARVVCRVKNSVRLPGNTAAALRETALLGERYVALDPPRDARPRGKLRPGAVLVGAHVDPDTEQVLGALSAVLNGGSIGRLEEISTELNAALDGRTGAVKSVLHKLRTFTGELNQHRDDIADALDALDRLSSTVADQRDVVAAALDEIPGGLQVLHKQRPQFSTLLRRLSELSDVAVPLIDRSKANSVHNLKRLKPILAELSRNGREIASSLELSVDYPFGGNSLPIIRGDYGGFFATVRVDMDTLNQLLREKLPQGGGQPGSGQRTSEPPAGLPDLELPNGVLPATPNLVPAQDLGDLLTGGAP